MSKNVNLLSILILLTVVDAFSQSIEDNVHLLDCKTWGTPDWHVDSIQIATGRRWFGDVARIIWDHNIEPVLPYYELMYDYYNDEIYFRWLLKDTSIYYNIRISTDQEEVLFETTSNDCGVKVGLKSLARLVHPDFLLLRVQRPLGQRGISYAFRPLPAEEYQKIDEFLKKEIVTKRRTTRQRLLETADYFYLHKMNLDALSYLEYAIEIDPHDPEIIRRYWNLLNQMALK